MNGNRCALLASGKELLAILQVDIMDHYSYVVTYYYVTAHIVHSSIAVKRIQYKLVGLTNLYEIFKDKIL